jgi:predicted SAM-dependent methyltransferase
MKKIKQLQIQLKGVRNLNIGCLNNYVPGWVNIGLFMENEYPLGIITKENKCLILNFDIRKELPIKKNSITYIYTSHLIEHLSIKEAIVFLGRCYKYMRRGGNLRIAFPDMGIWIQKYYEDDIDFFNTYYSFFKKWAKLPELHTKGQVLMLAMHGWGHKWFYDLESMIDVLRRAGFSNISRKNIFESAIKDIHKLELSYKERTMETIYMEAVK